MPYARTDESNRIIEWCRDKLEGFDVEFSNGDYVDKTCVDGLDDFVIVDGLAVFDPLPEKVAAREEKAAREQFMANAPAYFAALTSAFGEVE